MGVVRGLAAFIAGLAAVVATVDTLKLVRDHLVYNRKDDLRKYIIRIILMVPAYSVSSMGGIVYKDSWIYFDTVRECYEAFVIYSFFQFLVQYLGGNEELPQKLSKALKQQQHVIPFCFLTPWRMGNEFYRKIKFGTLQYVIFKPILAWLSFALYQRGMYGSGEFRLDKGYLWVTLLTNASQIWAMYCLALFYMACKDDLSPIRPIGKFMVVKAVVFFTWWQSVVLAVLVRFEWIHRSGEFSVEDVVNGTQNLLICLEMLLAAVAHRHTFPVKDFRQLFSDPNSTKSTVRSIFDAMNVTDVFVNDVWEARKTFRTDERWSTNFNDQISGSRMSDIKLGPIKHNTEHYNPQHRS